LDDCEAFTTSFGCTVVPSERSASVASTSLAFMFEDVPEPVWKTSIGNWSSCSPRATSAARFDDRRRDIGSDHCQLGVDDRWRAA